jgi:thiamine biosynthesis lipoprotein
MSKTSTEACNPEALIRHALNGPAMGARWSATFYSAPDCDTPALHKALADAVEMVEQQMSTWRPNSDLMRFNAAPVGAWIAIPRELAEVLDTALAIGRLSDGAFDIGVGDLVTAWGFGGGSRTPDAAAIRGLTGRPAIELPQALEIDVAGCRARKFAPLALDLSGIAKGYGVDVMAKVMEEFGIASYLVGIDGEMRAGAVKPDGRPWSVGHERPDRDARAAMGMIDLDNAAVATSGNYRHVVDVGGAFLSHTMDPRRGAPLLNRLASVTVVAETAMLADAWATALMVLGPEAGLDRARKLGLGAILVTTDQQTLVTGL